MGLFRADFFRSMAAGFVLGAIGLVTVLGSADSGSMVSAAIAAPAPAPSALD